jgi:predicted alpha-1,2-mannosidase
MDFRNMHRGLLVLFALSVLLSSCSGGRAPGMPVRPAPAPGEDPLPLVNPFVGTGGLGFSAGSLVPGPQWPNGMIRPSPDTGIGSFAPSFQHFAGYWFNDTHVRGFSNTRLVGTGAADQGNIRLMPVPRIDNTTVSDDGYRSAFSHENEEASVGYYRVLLEDTGIQAELASLRRVAVHRYTFPAGIEDPGVVVDVTASILPGEATEAEVFLDPAGREISGSLVQRGSLSSRFGGLPTFFVVRFSKPFQEYGIFENDRVQPRNTHGTGNDLGAFATFAPESGSPGGAACRVRADVALSFIGIDQARRNLREEMEAGRSFEEAVEANRQAWREKLGAIEITGGTETQRRIFYTALYHAYMMPTLFTESGGRYMGFDGQVHVADDFTYHTDMSLWDTFRTLHPLMALVDPDRARDFVISLIRMYEQGGDLPRWPMGRGYTGCMIGTHADSVIAEAWLKGVGDFDVETAYQGMRRHALGPVPNAGRDDMEHYSSLGTCTTDHTGQAPSKTVEYAYDDFCVGGLARELGYEEDAALFLRRAGNYARLWDPETGFLRGRDSSGAWYEPFLPLWPFAEEYVEGDAWHWLWFAPHDVPGLISLFGGPGPFVDKLDFFFRSAREQPDTFLPDLYYWHGNEPDIHAAYLFNEAGRPDLTAEWVRWILRDKYGDRPDGIDGNDDGGTLSSWYIFSALGFYPLNPCDGRYMIGSPIFDTATLHLPGGDLVVSAENVSGENLYVQSARLHGRLLEHPWFHHREIRNGGRLELVMGPVPGAWSPAEQQPGRP